LGPKEEVEENGHIPNIEVHVGDGKPTRISKDNLGRTIDLIGLVGSPTRTSRTNDNSAGNKEIQHGARTFREHISVEGARHSVGHGDLERETCAGQETGG
jgi:hypothetical protein